ncbi:MAG: hypothetical protein AAGG38_00675 [Planctomycetota bacterium]
MNYRYANPVLAGLTVALCLSLIFSADARAEFNLTWYASSTNVNSDPEDLIEDGISRAIVYNGTDDVQASLDNAQRYLDRAAVAGVDVILGMSRDVVQFREFGTLTQYVNQFKDHSALVGWYIYDEPNFGIDAPDARAAYNVIKFFSGKPVYGAFSSRNPDNVQNRFADSHDQMASFFYPANIGDAEFEGLESVGSTPGWKEYTAQSALTARLNGKAWHSVVQAYGIDRDRNDPRDFRLPTRAELRFMTYYSIVAHDADSVAYWARYRTDGSDALADEAYSRNGFDWRRFVFKPLVEEFNTHLAAAVDAGALRGDVSSSDPGDVHVDLYQDPDTGKYYLITVNDESQSRSATITFDINPELELRDVYAIDGSQTLALTDNQFQIELGAYEVQSFEVRLIPEPSTLVLMLPSLLLIHRRGKRKDISPDYFNF